MGTAYHLPISISNTLSELQQTFIEKKDPILSTRFSKNATVGKACRGGLFDDVE